jgi:hypothetical protein
VNTFAHAMLLGWVPMMLALFALVRVRTAILVACIGGWLLLPQLLLRVQGLPDYERTNAISLSMLLGCLLFAPGPLFAVRPSWRDLPMAIWILSTFASSIANDTGLHDATYAVVYRFIDWGMPYWIGRAFFASPAHMRTMLWGIFLGGLAYVLPSLWEIRMSPQLHRIVYGAHHHSWLQTFRGGGFRPQVFTPHGLALSMWLAVATVAGAWLWRRRAATKLFGVPLGLLVLVTGSTMVLCKSFGATLLLGFGLVLALAPFGRALHIAALILVPIYLAMRLTHMGGVDELLDAWVHAIPVDRAESLQFRLDNETLLVARGWERPVFGWTAWGFLVPIENEYGEVRNLVSDSMWIIYFACHGLVGLVSFVVLFLMPGIKGVAARVRTAAGIPASEVAVVGLLVTLFLVDSLVNSFVAPIYILAAGAVIGARVDRGPLARQSPSAADECAESRALQPSVRAAVLRSRVPR